MNRALLMGIAMFFAVVGLALVGGEAKTVMAGHGCHCAGACDGGCDGGCHKACSGCHKKCDGCHDSCSCGGLLARLRARRCCKPACCEPACCKPACCAPKCGGEKAAAPKAEEKKPAAAPPAPAKTSSLNRGFRTVSFVR